MTQKTIHDIELDLAPIAHDSRIKLDGEDISSALTGIDIHVRVNGPTKVTLYLAPTHTTVNGKIEELETTSPYFKAEEALRKIRSAAHQAAFLNSNTLRVWIAEALKD